MAIFDLFSKREKRRKQEGKKDVFQYEDLPKPFRVQVIHIWSDALADPVPPDHFGLSTQHGPNVWWAQLFNAITREKGVFRLAECGDNPCAQCRQYLMTAPTEDALDLIELTFQFVDTYIRRKADYEREHWGLMHPDKAIEELNGRFREHGIGYEFAGGEIIRVDSKFIHAEAVKPSLQLLHGAGEGFSGPLDEFLKAHEYHRKGEQKDTISWALKAFESTLKGICSARNWAFDAQKDPARKLIEIVFSNGLVPAYLKNQFTALRSVLESGVPTARNKASGHGQGATPTSVPQHLAGFVLHLTASNIVFLIESHNAMK